MNHDRPLCLAKSAADKEEATVPVEKHRVVLGVEVSAESRHSGSPHLHRKSHVIYLVVFEIVTTVL